MKLSGISSMATRQVLAELAAGFRAQAGVEVAIESVGGVDAARRVAAGERFDIVVLASDAIDKLIAAGHLAMPRVDLMRSPVAIAVREGAPAPDVTSGEAVKRAVEAAASLASSTGPSGAHVQRLFERWGLADAVQAKLVQAPPGVPVGSLVAEGRAELGFQQLSELTGLPGIRVLGTLPADIAFITTFSAALPPGAPEAARAWLAYAAGPEAADAKRRHGMEPA
ncbi:MAG: molybdate ABC transporter substrate-binding protein [Rubrivivax sp.]